MAGTNASHSDEHRVSKQDTVDRRRVRSSVSRRTFLAASSVSVGAAGLAGCLTGNGSDDGGNGGDDTGGGNGGDADVELVWWHQENVPERIEVYEKLNERFMEEHENITVRQEAHTWGDIYANLQSAVDAGNQPDFWFNTPAFAMLFQAQDELVDLSDVMADLDEQYDYFDGARVPYEYDGGVWGIPNWNKGFNYVYRGDTFGEVDDWPPETWQEWLDGVSAVTDRDEGRHGFVLGATDNHFTYKQLYNLMAAKDSYIFGPDGGIMFDTEETVEVLDFYKRMFQESVPESATDWNWGEWDSAMLAGSVHSTSCYTAPFPYADDDMQDVWEVTSNPVPGDEWGGGHEGRFVSIDGISVFNEDKLDAIQKWIEFAHRPDIYGWWMRETNPTLFVPTHQAGWEADEYWADVHDEEPFKTMVEMQKDLDDMAYPGFRDIHVENDTYVGEALGVIEGSFPLGDVAHELIVEDRSPEEAAEWGQQHLESETGLEPSDEL